jgi:hypothetical protein
MKAAPLLLLAIGLGSAAGAQDNGMAIGQTLGQALSSAAPAARSAACKVARPGEVVVCGHSQEKYRIDPTVLAATRAADAAPPKPALDATAVNPCTGQDCGGGTIPLVGMALTALKAAELAADGDDWRDAFRTHPDAYQQYQAATASAARKGHISIGVTAGSK